MKMMIAIVAGLIGYCYWRGAELRTVHGELKEEVHRWEGEGGTLH